MKISFFRTKDEIGGIIRVTSGPTRLGTIRNGFNKYQAPWTFEDTENTFKFTGNNRVSVQRKVNEYYRSK